MGGVAVWFYAIPRTTFDLDFTLAIEPDALRSLFDEVIELGYTVPESYLAGLVDRIDDMPLVKFKEYVAGHAVDIDVFLAESPFQHEAMKRKRRDIAEGVEVWIASPEDLMLLKLKAARPRDFSDIAGILFTLGQLDVDYMRKWADQMGTRDKLENALSGMYDIRG